MLQTSTVSAIFSLMRTLFTLSFIIILFVLIRPVITYASLPCITYPDPWYKINLDFDKNLLPSGIQTYPHNEVYYYGRIQNNSATPLYLIKTPDKSDTPEDNNRYLNGELPATVTPIYKLVSGKAYFYVSASEEDKRVWGAQWSQNRGWKETSYPYVDFEGSLMDKMGIKIDDIKEDNRLSSIQPPQPQNFSMSVYYGKIPMKLQGKIVYQLNNNYDPQGEVKREKTCKTSKTGISVGFPPLITMGVSATALIALFVTLRLILIKKH